MNEHIRKHLNAAVEAKAIEIEAFVLAMLRAHPTRHLSDFELAEQSTFERGKFVTIYTVRLKS
jgi:hypothetical protein